MSTSFFDLQVNGYAGVDFNADDVTPESLRGACEKLRGDGAERILATVVTDAPERMVARLARIARIRAADPLVRDVVHGIHVEGPFLSAAAGFVGAHPAEHTRDADPDLMRRLCDAADGLVRLVTLAPERDPQGALVRMLHERDVRVAAGHTDASLGQLRRAADLGLGLLTHLGNGCPALLHRHDNVVQRALTVARERDLWCCFIADGAHVPFFALGNYLRTVGVERSVVVTDAIAAAGLGPGRYRVLGLDVVVGDDLVARPARAPRAGDDAAAHFVGSAATMPHVARLLHTELGLSAADVLRLCRDNPRRALGLPVEGAA